MTRTTVGSIFAEAKLVVVDMHNRGEQPTARDYEHFKHMLHNSGHFGYESKLADILGL